MRSYRTQTFDREEVEKKPLKKIISLNLLSISVLCLSSFNNSIIEFVFIAKWENDILLATKPGTISGENICYSDGSIEHMVLLFYLDAVGKDESINSSWLEHHQPQYFMLDHI